MSDDIVVRLREFQDALGRPPEFTDTPQLPDEAAEEIDRLRAEVASLKEELAMRNQQLGKAATMLARSSAEGFAIAKQLIDSEATVKSLRAALDHTENTLIEVSSAQEPKQ